MRNEVDKWDKWTTETPEFEELIHETVKALLLKLVF